MMIPVIVIVCGILIFGVSHAWKKYPHDNIVEEIVEDVIQVETGADVDLTPNSPESQ